MEQVNSRFSPHIMAWQTTILTASMKDFCRATIFKNKRNIYSDDISNLELSTLIMVIGFFSK